MLKLTDPVAINTLCDEQPPSGGCVLKQLSIPLIRNIVLAAAFGRLCVETGVMFSYSRASSAAAFGRLCVETSDILWVESSIEQPPSGGCVLKLLPLHGMKPMLCAAAFGRLCVET